MVLWIYLVENKVLQSNERSLEDIEKLILTSIHSSNCYTFIITTGPIKFYKTTGNRPIDLRGTWVWVIDINEMNAEKIQLGTFTSPERINIFWKSDTIIPKNSQRILLFNNLFIDNVIKKGHRINFFLNLIFRDNHFGIITSTDNYVHSDAEIVQRLIESRP